MRRITSFTRRPYPALPLYVFNIPSMSLCLYNAEFRNDDATE